jgi:hypothetical protein
VLLRLAYLALTGMIRFLRLLAMSNADKDVEIHALGQLEKHLVRTSHRGFGTAHRVALLPPAPCRATLTPMSPTATKVPFADASPAEIREVLIEEELPQFEADYTAALREAAETYSLDTLNRTMEYWRRIAWMTTAKGPEAHRRMLAQAEHLQRTGKPLPGTKTYTAEESKAMARQRLAELGVS